MESSKQEPYGNTGLKSARRKSNVQSITQFRILVRCMRVCCVEGVMVLERNTRANPAFAAWG